MPSSDGVIDTYTKLKDAVSSETDGTANSASLDRFVNQAEGEIRAFLRLNPVRPMRARSTLTISSEYITAPGDMIKPISIEVVDGEEKYRLPYVAPENLSMMQNRDLDGSRPYAFTREGDELRFYPEPTSSYSGTLFYYENLPQLGDSNASNWLLADFPHVYQAGALYYAYRDMPDIAKAQLMKAVFDEGLQMIAASYPEPDNEVTLASRPDAMTVRWSILR